MIIYISFYVMKKKRGRMLPTMIVQMSTERLGWADVGFRSLSACNTRYMFKIYHVQDISVDRSKGPSGLLIK